MDSLKNSLLGEIVKAFPKSIGQSLITSYLTTARIPPKIVKHTKVKHSKPQKFADGSIYTGQLGEDNDRVGVGVLYTPSNNSIYEGCFKNNNFKGFGRLFKSEFIIEGIWRGASLKSTGKIYNLKNSTEYEGEISGTEANGQGKMSKKNEWTYVGSFKNGLKHGQGIFIWSLQGKYEGNFVNDKQEGIGKFYWNDGAVYEGEWLKNKMHGKGVYECKEFRYEGQYVSGSKQGHGICEWKSGKRYEGFWMKDKYDGIGTEINEKGEIQTCVWRNGSIINSHSRDINSIISGLSSSRNSEVKGFNNFDSHNGLMINKQKEIVRSKKRVQDSQRDESNDSLDSFKEQTEKLSESQMLKKLEIANKLNFSPMLAEISPRLYEKEGSKHDFENELNLSNEISGGDDEPNQFEAGISLIFDEPGPGDEMENDIGEGIKEFVMSSSSKEVSNRSLKQIEVESKQISLEKINNKDSNASLVKNSDKSSMRMEDSRSSNKNFNNSPRKQLSTGRKSDKILVVGSDEVRLKIRMNPMFQVSYQVFKTLPVFEFLPQDAKLAGISSTEDWIELPKEKTYKGEVNANNEPCGNGVLLKKGTIYQGNMINGKKHGVGRLITALGRVYEGYFVKGKRQGFGVFTSDTEIYCGDWYLGSYHGLGVLQNKNGTYDGRLVYGICEGFGKLLYKDGREYVGEFKEGVPHGYGDMKIESIVESGHWRNGVQRKLELEATKRVMPIGEKKLHAEDSMRSESSESEHVTVPAEIDD